MQRIACDERADWREKADAGRLHLPHHGRRALLGRARLLRLHAEGDRAATSRRRPASSMRCAANWWRARSRRAHAQGAAHPGALLDLHRGKLEARRPEPLWPLRSLATTGRARRSCSNTTPTRRPRCSRPAVFQWIWLEDAKARAIAPKDADQYNSLHERLIEGWKEIGQTAATCILPATLDDPEDARHDRLSGGHRAAGRPCDHDARDGAASAARRRARSSMSPTSRSR